MNFISGHNLRDICNYILDDKGFRPNPLVQSTESTTVKYFVKTDYIDLFFNQLIPDHNFILITHNSDYSINSRHAQYLDNSTLVKWYAQNVDYQHEKLIPIPIGLANQEWPHGDTSIVENIMHAEISKTRLMYANFSIKTNPSVRQYCLQFIPQQYIENNVSFFIYMTHLAQSCFSICPLGNGIDSHRIWESLYVNTIPIAEKTYNLQYLQKQYNLPIIFIEDWGELPSLDLSSSIHKEMLNSWNVSHLDMTSFI